MATHPSILAWGIHMDRGAWQTIVPGVAEGRTQLSDLTLSSPGSGTTQRDRAGREKGGEFRTWWWWGNACMLLADSR